MEIFGRRMSYGLGDMRKINFEAKYLGWKPCQTMIFDDSVKALVNQIWSEHLHNSDATNTMHIQLSQKELKIVQYLSPQSGHKMEKYRFPPIPANDITFAKQCKPPELVATIILGYSATSKCYLHVHVFRFDSKEMAACFEVNVMDIVNQQVNKKRLAKIRDDLIEGGHLSPNAAIASPQPLHYGPRSIDVGKEDAMNLLAMELRKKLRPNPEKPDPSMPYEAPLLLPPRDYDTISRSHGDAIRHRQAIMAEKEALERNKPEMVDSVPSLQNHDDNDDPTTQGSDYDSPRSSGSGTSNRNTRGATGLNMRHSFGSADSVSTNTPRRTQLPFRANESMPANSWQTYKQN